MGYYYDTRYLLLGIVVFLPSFSSTNVQGNDSSGFLLTEIKLLFLSVLSAGFLFVSVRIQLCCFPWRSGAPRRIELRFGRSALSVPLTISLITTLFLPPSAFWNAYFVIFIISFWSDSIHSFFSRFSHAEERLMLLPLVQSLQDTTHQLQGAVDEASSRGELV